MREYGEERRGKVDEGHSGDRAGETQRRIAQFGEGGARHHPPEIGEIGIGAQAMDALRQPEPDRPLSLHDRAERAIVDQRAAQRFQTAGGGEGLAPRQHAAARRGRCPPTGIVNPGEGIEHLEEEHEGGNQPSLGRAFAAQLHHQRGEDAASGASDRDEAGEHMGRVGDVGVAEQHELGRRRARLDRRKALAHRP